MPPGTDGSGRGGQFHLVREDDPLKLYQGHFWINSEDFEAISQISRFAVSGELVHSTTDQHNYDR